MPLDSPGRSWDEEPGGTELGTECLPELRESVGWETPEDVRVVGITARSDGLLESYGGAVGSVG